MLKKMIGIFFVVLMFCLSSSRSYSSCGYTYNPDKPYPPPVVSSASGYEEQFNEIPTPMTIISPKMIKNIGAKNLKDVLITYVPGMTYVQDHNEVNVAGRGIYTSSQQKMLIMLNGHRLNSRSFSGANPDYSISLDKIECIEVLRAPVSSLYGNAALTAVINIITNSLGKKGTERKETQINVSVGNYGQRKLSVIHRDDFNNEKRDLLVWGTYYQSDGENVNVPAEEDYSREPKDSHAILDGFNEPASYDVGINYELGDFTLLANQRASKYTEPFSSGGDVTGESYNNSDYRKIRDQGPGQLQKFSHLGLDYNKGLDKGLNLQFQLYYDLYEHNSHKIVEPTQDKHNFLAWNEQAYGLLAQLNGSYTIDSNKSIWMVGIQEDRMTVEDSELLTRTGSEWASFFDDNGYKVLDTGRERISSVFAQIKHRFSGEWIGNFGMRFDRKKRHQGETLDEISPRLALIWVPKDNFDVKLSYSKAFMDAPHWYRYSALPSYVGSKSLKPEYMDSYQLTPTIKLANGKVINSLNFFYNKFSDFIWRNNNVFPQYQNAGFLKVWGIENEILYFGGDDVYNIAFNFTIKKWMTYFCLIQVFVGITSGKVSS